MADDEREYIYGYGKTKHIADPDTDPNRVWGWRGRPSLCGAEGGYPMEAPDRPVCKRCEREAARRVG
jgi:hypothetical protein